MDEKRVAGWLTDYVAAWESYDSTAIGRLFSEDAVYRWHPWDEPDEAAHGRESIVASWLEDRDDAGSWAAEYRPWLVHEGRAVAVGISRYLEPDGSVKQEYHNVFLLAFDRDGCCREFTELFMLRPT